MSQQSSRAEKQLGYNRDYYRRNKDRHQESQRRQREKKRALVVAAKRKPCVDCGREYHPAVMEFHHRDPSQKNRNISDAFRSFGIARLAAEIDKCDLLCANCHRLREIGLRPDAYEHIEPTVEP